MKVLAVGSDPEFFIQDLAGNIIPSRGIIPGNKKKPRPLVWGAVHRDNVACELNPIPASSEREFSSNFLNLKAEVEDKLLRSKGMSLVVKTSHEFSHEQLNYREAQEFGCDGDFTIWEHIQPPVMRDPYSLVRSAGGHIHIAIDGLSPANLATVISRLDMLISVPLVLLDPDKLRRQSYGKAGCYRHKPYGIEYRTPSNVWCGSDELRRWVYRQVVRAVEYDDLSLFKVTGEFSVGCINASDRDRAEYLCNMFNLEVPL
jgi:hypothetical protein